MKLAVMQHSGHVERCLQAEKGLMAVPHSHDRVLQQLTGAINALGILRQELEQWLGEAQDESSRETLENVVAHVAAMEEECLRRREEQAAQLPQA
ncbi:MAG: hypothetical protein M0037_12930 [Betaproteobacteria bacterium]|nr:hypothetical protein [Betaproteobacteria bacterium]